MRIFLLIFLCFSSNIGVSQMTVLRKWDIGQPLLIRVKQDTLIPMYFYFGDEFVGNTLNSEKWYDNYPWGGLEVENHIAASPHFVSQKNGLLVLKTDRADYIKSIPNWMLTEEFKKKNQDVLLEGNTFQVNYSTSAIYSKTPFQYGYFEARCKVPAQKGVWPAFWLYGQNNKDEIDFMEMKGERTDNYHIDIHHPDKKIERYKGFLVFKKRFGAWLKADEDIVEKWVTYSGLWEPNKVTFFMDGMPTGVFYGDFETQQNIILNSSIAVDGKAFSPGPDNSTIFPNYFEVDYVRLWTEGYYGKDAGFPNRNVDDEMELATITKKSLPKKMNAKRKLNNEQGFISIMPTKLEHVFQLRLSGVFSPVTIQLMNQENQSAFTQTFINKSQLLNLSHLDEGKYTLIIQIDQNSFERSINLKK